MMAAVDGGEGRGERRETDDRVEKPCVGFHVVNAAGDVLFRARCATGGTWLGCSCGLDVYDEARRISRERGEPVRIERASDGAWLTLISVDTGIPSWWRKATGRGGAEVRGARVAETTAETKGDTTTKVATESAKNGESDDDEDE